MEPSPWLVAAIELRKELANHPAEIQQQQRQLDRPHYPKQMSDASGDTPLFKN